MSDWEEFRTKCPSCSNNERCYWIHTTDEYHEKINKEGDIRCNNTSCYYYNNPTFIMEWKFKCGDRNHGDYRKPNSTNIWVAIGMVSSITNLSKDERDKLYSKISDYID